MRWLANNLTRKFAFGTAAGLLISSLVFLYLYMHLYQTELAMERANVAEQVNSLLQTSLENAMLKRDLEGLQYIVNKLGNQPGIVSVFITNPGGEVRFANSKDQVGRKVPPPDAPSLKKASPITLFTQGEQGMELLRNINPVLNREACKECHGPAAINPVNGILYVDYDASPLRRQARETTLLLMSAGALIVLINIIGGWWFINRFVLQPVNRLTLASGELTAGRLDTRIALKGSDELAQLGVAFNRMAKNLQEKIDELGNQRAFLQSLVDAIPDGVRVISMDYRILLTNRTYKEQLRLGDQAVTGQFCYSSSHGRDHPCPATLITCPLHEIRNHPRPVKSVHRQQRADGSIMVAEVFAAPMDVVIEGKRQIIMVESIRDLAEQVKYSQEQKLSELGRLATGIAHEIYNPLASVRLALHGTNQQIEREDCSREEIKEYLHLVDHEVDKCIDITERLLKLSAPPASALELVYLSHVLDETLSLLNWEAKENAIAIEKAYPAHLRVLATDSEMRMASLNMAQNAFHAMPHGGALRISADRRDGWIELSFADQGVGILPEDMDRIFDPFFSRRADGKQGTGLGLSITRTIVENYGGVILVDSIPQQGSRFTIRLPDADSNEQPSP